MRIRVIYTLNLIIASDCKFASCFGVCIYASRTGRGSCNNVNRDLPCFGQPCIICNDVLIGTRGRN